MSSELERLLRDAREALPVPDEPSTQRARRQALATLRRRRRRGRAFVLAVTMLAVAVTLGVTAGSLNAPSVTAAREPAVLGFVPEPGWFALQSPPPAIEGQQAVAVAANVPFAADDVDNGLVEPSGLPYSTLLALPPHGIVIVSTMTPQSDPHIAPVPMGSSHPRAELPLQLSDGIPVVHWGQVRPEQPMAQYHLGASLHGYNVDVVVYFGTAHPSEALLRHAQRQLDGFVARPGVAARPARPTTSAVHTDVLAVIDRTYTCDTVILGGIYEIEARAHAGLRTGRRWSKLAYTAVASGGWAGTLLGNPFARENSLAWVTAGTPSVDTTADYEGETFPIHTGGTIGVNTSLCRPLRAAVPLKDTGVRGRPSGVLGDSYDCPSPRKVFVRMRATTLSAASLSRRGNVFLASNAVVRRGELAVRTPAGKLLAYGDVSESGKARLFTAKGCMRE